MPTYMTLEEASRELDLSPSTLRQQALSGILRAEKIGHIYVVTPKEVERYRTMHKGKHGNRTGSDGKLRLQTR